MKLSFWKKASKELVSPMYVDWQDLMYVDWQHRRTIPVLSANEIHSSPPHDITCTIRRGFNAHASVRIEDVKTHINDDRNAAEMNTSAIWRAAEAMQRSNIAKNATSAEIANGAGDQVLGITEEVPDTNRAGSEASTRVFLLALNILVATNARFKHASRLVSRVYDDIINALVSLIFAGERLKEVNQAHVNAELVDLREFRAHMEYRLLQIDHSVDADDQENWSLVRLVVARHLLTLRKFEEYLETVVQERFKVVTKATQALNLSQDLCRGLSVALFALATVPFIFFSLSHMFNANSPKVTMISVALCSTFAILSFIAELFRAFPCLILFWARSSPDDFWFQAKEHLLREFETHARLTTLDKLDTNENNYDAQEFLFKGGLTELSDSTQRQRVAEIQTRIGQLVEIRNNTVFKTRLDFRRFVLLKFEYLSVYLGIFDYVELNSTREHELISPISIISGPIGAQNREISALKEALTQDLDWFCQNAPEVELQRRRLCKEEIIRLASNIQINCVNLKKRYRRLKGYARALKGRQIVYYIYWKVFPIIYDVCALFTKGSLGDNHYQTTVFWLSVGTSCLLLFSILVSFVLHLHFKRKISHYDE